MTEHITARAATRALVVHPLVPGGRTDKARDADALLAEAVGLTQAIALDVVGARLVRLRGIRPSTLLGKGKVAELAADVERDAIELVYLDAALTPVQQRNLERALKAKVIDRTGLILEIFGERARTREGRLQVEMAALTYQRSRLVRSWTHLERQRGGFGFLGGPGESQIEADRRLIDERLVKLRRELALVARTRALHRRARQRVPYPLVALVGYTNAGKSTLFNRLTGAAVFADDRLFATLDPTLRGLALPSGRRIILSDTVGFVSDLPTALVAAFRATLEEVVEADLIVHVRDASHPDTVAQRADVHDVLRSLDLGHLVDRGMLIEAHNKIDLLDAETHAVLRATTVRHDGDVAISAVTGQGCDDLLALLDRRLRDDREVVDLLIPHDRGEAIAWLYRHGEVIARKDQDDGTHLKVGLDRTDLDRYAQRWGL
ncbi:MAG: GTPase HflX [Alphaproteobacteria bacterium]|nr:GTPase HflX [Alphaproteobacteria bacterium]